MKGAIFLCFCSFAIRAIAICPQDIHATFLLASQDRKTEAKKILLNSFSASTDDLEFISEQFVNWIAKHPSQMNDTFNKSAYHVVSKESNLAKKTITNYFSYEDPEISDFAQSFVIWGTELMEIDETLNHKER